MPTSWPEVMQHPFQVGHQGHGTNLLMEGPGGDTGGITPQLDVLADGLDMEPVEDEAHPPLDVNDPEHIQLLFEVKMPSIPSPLRA